MASVTPDKIVISPVFLPPEGAEEIFTQKGEINGQPQSEFIDETSSTGLEDDDDAYVDTTTDEDGNTITLETPNVVVFDQSYARAPGGQILVDIILQIDDVAGATTYEVQYDRT